jgi:hypothetical protein
MLTACQVSSVGPRDHRHGALDTAAGREGLDSWSQAPGLHVLVECEVQTSQAFRLCRNGLDVFRHDELLSGGGTHHVAEPSPVGGPPVGPTWRAESMPPHAGLQTQRGRLQIPQGLFTRPTQVAAGGLVDGGPLHGGEVP